MGETVTLARRRLALQLKQMRVDKGIRAQDVVDQTDVSQPTLSRIERGTTRVKSGNVLTLLRLYEASPDVTDRLVNLALATSAESGFLEDYQGAVHPDVGLYLELERVANRMWFFEPDLIHGLFQIPTYTRAVCQANTPPVGEEAIQKQIKLRSDRREALIERLAAKPAQLEVAVILGEEALRRPVGGPGIIAAQVGRLREMATFDGLDLRVLPLSAGAHAAMGVGAFAILDFPDEADRSIVYLEGHTGARYLERSVELDAYRAMFAAVYAKTTSIEGYEQGEQC